MLNRLVILLVLLNLYEHVYAELNNPVLQGRASYSDRLRNYITKIHAQSVAEQPNLVDIIIETDNFDSVLATQISRYAGKLKYHFGREHEIRIPENKLQLLLNVLPATAYVRLPYPHEAAAVTSKGVDITGATDMHLFSFGGSGVKIGIIDLGFADYTGAQTSGDLPTNLTITDYTGSGIDGTNHGTQVAEIVHDMAPNSELYLAKVATSLQLQQATNDMIAAGVKIINHSVAWFGAAFYDGTGPLCSVTSTAETSGVLWFNAMGNSRNKHFLGTFTDNDNNLKHEFASDQNYNPINLNAGGSVTLILNWDAYPVTNIDYNLYLYNGDPDAGGVVVASSANRQSGNVYSAPYEALDYTASTAGTYYIVVSKNRNSTANVPFTIFSLGPDLGIKTYSSSLPQPADCSSVVSVGATNLSDGPEYFSSEGPTTDGRNKPEISAPNRVMTSLSSSFAGTSVSSPHAAGAAALIIEQTAVEDVIALRSKMISQLFDISASGFDYRTGYGRISLDADLDGVNHDIDNCPLVANTNQYDMDIDGLGDLCDDDIDGDGLLNNMETTLGTNPYLIDSDGDSLSDFDEVNVYSTSPLNMDSDNDGLSDYDEIVVYGMDPLENNRGDLAPYGKADGLLNIADLLVLYRFVENMDVPNAKESILADINQDGQLDVRDALLLRQLLGY